MRRYQPSRRRGARCLLACLLLSSLVCGGVCGCGVVRIQGVLGAGAEAVSGFVSSVQLISVGSNGTTIEVTVVTLQQTLGFTTTDFCGNVVTQFPMKSFVQVSFTPGQPCSTIVVIEIEIKLSARRARYRLNLPMTSAWARMCPCIACSTAFFVAPGFRLSLLSRA